MFALPQSGSHERVVIDGHTVQSSTIYDRALSKACVGAVVIRIAMTLPPSPQWTCRSDCGSSGTSIRSINFSTQPRRKETMETSLEVAGHSRVLIEPLSFRSRQRSVDMAMC